MKNLNYVHDPEGPKENLNTLQNGTPSKSTWAVEFHPTVTVCREKLQTAHYHELKFPARLLSSPCHMKPTIENPRLITDEKHPCSICGCLA